MKVQNLRRVGELYINMTYLFKLIKKNGIFLAKFLAVAILLVVATFSKAQYQANNWYFGNGAGLNFNFNPPSLVENGSLPALSNMEGVGTMSDASGNLLFYTNGLSVFNKNHVTMPAGTGLLGGDGSSTQSGLCLQVNGSTSQYFIIGTHNTTGASYYSIVDMAAASGGGLGDVTTKNSPLLASNCSEGVVAIPEYDAASNPTGENWIIFHDIITTNNFRVYKTNGSTISFVTSYAVGPVTGQQALILKTNGCFNKIAMTTFSAKGEVDIYPFNNNTGVISAPTLTLTQAGGAFLTNKVYGVEFSPNDQFLYVTNSGGNGEKTVYQFDITLGIGTNPAAVLASKSSYTGADANVIRFGHLQLGPDGKIYCPGYTTTAPSYMSVIPTPNVAWTRPTPTASEFQFEKYTFYTKRVGEGLPVFSQDLLRQLRIYYNTACEGGSTNFSYAFGGSAVSQSWNFGDAASGALNTSTLVSPSHTYNTAGTYTVNLSVVDNCGRTRTATINVIIKPGPQVTVPSGACPNTNVVLTGTGLNKANYMWYNDAATTTLLAGPAASYTYNGPLPKTIYVKDPTPLATYVTGNTTAIADAASDVGDTRFEVYTTIKLLSFQVIGKTPGTGGTINLYKWNGTAWALATGTEAWSQTYAAPVNGTTYTFNPNVTLSAGKYRLFATDDESFKKNNTTINGGRDVAGVIALYGDSDGSPKGGPYLNLSVELPDPCGVRAYTIANTCGLPVDWESFTGKTVGDDVYLIWQVAREKNNSHFIVQRSDDGRVFQDLGIVKAGENNESSRTYNYYDLSPEKFNYYRIVQVDINGTISYSSVIYVSLIDKDIIASPNPFDRQLNLSFSFSEEAKVDVFDVTGKLIQTLNKSNGEYTMTIGDSFNKGVYIVRVYLNECVKSVMVIKE